MAGIDRKSALCEQTRITGIDFIQVVEPLVQTVLRVFFIVEPSALDVPLVDPALLQPPAGADLAGPPLAEPNLVVAIVSPETGAAVEITSLAWRLVHAPSGLRLALDISVAAPGDFSLHRLHIDHALVDPFFNNTLFSFKQGCPSVFDCRAECVPEPPDGVDFPIDYLARDFFSLRRALLDFAAERYPTWREPLEADQAVMLLEIMAAMGDDFAYAQDRIAREATLQTATQRRSRSGLARLVDYFPDPGNAAETELAVWASAGGTEPAVGARAWALPEGRDPIPFSVRTPVWHHADWNEIPLHWPDSDVACLEKGATEAFLLTDAPTAGQLPPGATVTPEAFWVGRRAILRSRPGNPAEPARACAITITAVSHLLDELAPVPGTPTAITRIAWSEPTPFPLPFAETSALLNIVPVIAGEEVTERFRIGPDSAVAARFPALSPEELSQVLALPRAIEREGPFDPDRGARGRALRYGLRASESRGLGWTGRRDPTGLASAGAQQPMLRLAEVLPPAFGPDPSAATWVFFRDLLAGDLDSSAFTLEEGIWRAVVTHQTPFEDVVFQDYAGDDGWTLRFGAGDFGRPPADGGVFAVSYFTAPGSAANLAPDSITHLAPPPNAPPGPLFGYAAAVTNPLAITSGGDEAAPETIRVDAPEAFRALPLRAVRPEDYGAIVERLPWVQRANAVTRWTGSWSSDFVAADPLGGVTLARDERDELEDIVDCIRQATRDVRVVEADYMDIDLEIEVCVLPTAYPREVELRIVEALAPPGFFSPDNFTFGQPLRRSALEAAVQNVPGVMGVEAIRMRVRRRRDWLAFTQPALTVEPRQIIRLQNDPLFPGRGSVRVSAHGGAA